MADFLPFIIFLMILALFLKAESALTIFYMILGIFLLSLWWSKRSLHYIDIHRDYEDHAFLGQDVPVKLVIENRSILPILWLEIHESLPVNLRAGREVKQVFSLGIRGRKEINYTISALKRGYYSLGPLQAHTGDPFGLVKPGHAEYKTDTLTIYPRIVSLDSLGLPSRSPFGTLKHKNPIFEDPSRIMGKREFQHGDSIRRIDWKSTAASGQLQVKLYEASIALATSLLLDLDRRSYRMMTYYDATELAITAAASLAAWGKAHKQSFGLVTNGLDPSQENKMPLPLPPKKGSGHFINMLEILARIQPGNSLSIETFIQEACADLSWGTTIVLISGGIRDQIVKQLFQARKTGLNPVVMIIGQTENIAYQRRLAGHYKIPLYTAASTRELQVRTTNRS